MNELPDIEIIIKMVHKSNEKYATSGNNYKEKSYDDTVSRAYYAVFHCISAVLFTKGLTFSTHGQTIGAFNKEFINQKLFPEDYNKKIEKLFRLRQAGDYDIDTKIDKDSAEEGLNIANEIMNSCKQYIANLYDLDFNILGL